jgi:hypothetical protein
VHVPSRLGYAALFAPTGLTATLEAPAARPAAARRTAAPVLVLAAAVVLTLALRAPFARLPFGVDEGGLSFIARQWGTGHGSLYGAYWLDRPPLLVALFSVAARGGELGVRALGALAAAGLVVAARALATGLGGPRAGAVAAVLAAVFASSYALAAVYTPAELLAAVPAAASIACLLAAHRGGRARGLAAGGMLAVSAALIKQSFLDAGAAGAVCLAASTIREPRAAVRRVAAYAGGAVVPIAGVGVLLAASHMSASALLYAVFGFRVHALALLAGSGDPLPQRVSGLGRPVLGSGMAAALALAPFGLLRLQRDRVVTATVAGWLVAGVAGVLGGGTYWPHYLLQLAVPAAVLAGVALSRLDRRACAAATVAIAAVGIGVTGARAARYRTSPPRQAELAVARFIHRHDRAGDTQYVLYARANLDYYVGLPSPFPYEWSLMARGVPRATARLDRLLASRRRPTWIVSWQPARAWDLDPHHVIRRALRAGYGRVATVRGHPVYLRRELVARRGLAPHRSRSRA